MAITWQDLLYPGRAQDFFQRTPLPPFDPDRSDYDCNNAWWLAELSRLVYRCDMAATPSASLDVLLERGGWRRLGTFGSRRLRTQALLVQGAVSAPCAVLVFRGTEQKLQDFVHDADARLVPAVQGSARIHRGFARALAAVWPQINHALPHDVPLFFTGHSLGAALAILAATHRPPRAVYGFGAPRVGDAGVAQLLRAVPVHRIVHGDDIVTVVPPSALGFRHVGEEIHIGVAVMQHAKLDPRQLWTGLGLPPKPLADHAPINYSRLLCSAQTDSSL
jgi:hypothetical protein